LVPLYLSPTLYSLPAPWSPSTSLPPSIPCLLLVPPLPLSHPLFLACSLFPLFLSPTLYSLPAPWSPSTSLPPSIPCLLLGPPLPLSHPLFLAWSKIHKFKMLKRASLCSSDSCFCFHVPACPSRLMQLSVSFLTSS
jgi:hypothetical protein